MTILRRPAELRTDPLVRNSFFLMATTALSAAGGFVFWVVVARLYSVDDVGRATTLLSAVTLLNYFSQFGLTSTVVRFLPGSRERDELVGSAVTLVTVTGLVLAAGFAVIAPHFVPELSFVSAGAGTVGLFAVLATASALNLLTDSVFVALRAAKVNLLVDGVLMGGLKLLLPLLFAAAGAMGIFAASGLASAAAALVSVVVMYRVSGIRVRLRLSRHVLRSTMRYSLGNYLSSCLNLLPLLVIPVVVLHQLGPATAAAYFMAFQIANLLNAVPFAVGEATFAEGSHDGEMLRRLAKRSALLMTAVCVPAVAVTILLAHPVLSVFGRTYADDAQGALVVLAISVLPVAFNTWASFLLKVTRRLRVMTVSNVVYAVATIGLVLVAAPHGPAWIAAAWGAGNLLSGLAALPGLRWREAR